jgi:hypothetical protein
MICLAQCNLNSPITMLYLTHTSSSNPLLFINIVFKHPVALIYPDTQYNSIKNATTPITPSSHNMFWQQTAIFRCLSHAKTVPLSTYSHHINCNNSRFKI